MCEPAAGLDQDRLDVLIGDLVDTMRALPRCVGLAAPQIGEAVRVAVVDVSGHSRATTANGLMALVDPVVVDHAGAELGREGCVSLPALTVDVLRARRLVLESGAGRAWCAGCEARAVQHEIDHLEGILILDRAATGHAIHVRGPEPGG